MLVSCETTLIKAFKDPPDQYKPMPFWHINGELSASGIRQQMTDAREAGFSGVSLLPLAEKSLSRPGTSPRFLTQDYFERYQDLLNVAEELDMEIILYDDNDFPSGMAGGKMEALYPDHTMKRLDKIEYEVKGPQLFESSIHCVKLMSAVAINSVTNKRIEISDYAVDGLISWQVPRGEWKIMLFPLVKDTFHKKYLCVDFMDTVAVRYMINETYEKYKERFEKHFGNTITTTFFDDVGFWRHPRSWTALFNKKFEEMNGFDPRPYYPALWYNTGPDTEAIRNAFFNTRAELLAEGFPKLVAQWNEKNGLRNTGHPPGNYDPTPIDMNGDVFKFYRYTHIPLTDAIIKYQFGQNGHKLISSASDYYDRPVVATEVYGAFKENTFDSLMLYRAVMDLFVRGVNMVVPHGMWYNPDKVYISPLVSPYSEKIAAALPAYSDYVGRSSLMLRGGRRVSEIGVMYPFEGLAGWFCFDNPDNIRQGFYVAPETDYLDVSNWLTNDIRRDFTFIHPELLLDEKYSIEKGELILSNKENYQAYKTIILTGSKVISYPALQKLKAFYGSGGMIIATTMLPYKSAEIGLDDKVIALVKEIFGIDPLRQDTLNSATKSVNSSSGMAIFLPQANREDLQEALANSSVSADVIFTDNPVLKSDFGKFNYIHKIKDGKHIYFFTNSSNERITTNVLLRGKLDPEVWNPHSGSIKKMTDYESVDLQGQTYTNVKMTVAPVKSLFLVCEY